VLTGDRWTLLRYHVPPEQGTLGLTRQSLVDEIAELVGRRNCRVPQLPKLAVLQGFRKIICMATIERHEACSRAL
jgi:hypothetical protein